MIIEGNMKNYNKSGGSRFEDEGKAYGWWYAPMPGMKYVVQVAKNGAKKYAPLDWAEGQDFSTLYGCAMRHMIAAHPANKGMLSVNEDDGDQMHLAHAAWNLLCLLSLVAMGKADECNDVDQWRGVVSSDIPEGEDFESWSPGQDREVEYDEEDTLYGTVKWFDDRKGYGFIDVDSYSGDDVFVHYSRIKNVMSLSGGDRVRFTLELGKYGPKAESVEKIAPDEEDSYTSGSAISTIAPDDWR